MEELKILAEIAVALALPLGGFVFSLWKWDAKRAEQRLREAKIDYERQMQTAQVDADERAKERAHELQLAQAAAEREHQVEVKTLQETVIHLQQVVEERLFSALDDARAAKTTLASAVQEHIAAIDRANQAELHAIQVLQGDVTSLKQQLPQQYQDILVRIASVIDQTRVINDALGGLISTVAQYHESVECALRAEETNHVDPVGESV